MGPLGLVASAAAASVAAAREVAAAEQSRAQQQVGDSGSGEGTCALPASPRRPPPLLDLGIQLNLQVGRRGAGEGGACRCGPGVVRVA